MKKNMYFFCFIAIFGFYTFSNISAKDISSPYLEDSDIVTISDLKNKDDDSYVTLRGYIVKKIKGEKFLFKDSTGEIVLDIDNKINRQLKNVNKETLVEVYGEFEKEMFERKEIEVKKITIVK